MRIGREEMEELCEVVDLDVIGMTTSARLSNVEKRIREQFEEGFIPKEDYGNIEVLVSGCNPGNIMPDAKSVISVAECYLTSEKEDNSEPDDPHGLIARYTWRNYYKDVKVKLQRMGRLLKQRVGSCRVMTYSCGRLREKPFAERSGLGWYGKNGIIQTENYGSWVVLGELLTDAEIEPDSPLDRDCGNCEACIKACPTGAIVQPYVLDRKRCLQYLTNWRGIFSREVREVWGRRLYGCTRCQEVCPRNKKVRTKERKPPYGNVGSSYPLCKILRMSESGYKEKFKGNQMGAAWVNFDCIQRNACVALGNIGEERGVTLLEAALLNKSRIVRAHAAWALGKIQVIEAKRVLEKRSLFENEPYVKKEIEDALKDSEVRD